MVGFEARVVKGMVKSVLTACRVEAKQAGTLGGGEWIDPLLIRPRKGFLVANAETTSRSARCLPSEWSTTHVHTYKNCSVCLSWPSPSSSQ